MAALLFEDGLIRYDCRDCPPATDASADAFTHGRETPAEASARSEVDYQQAKAYGTLLPTVGRKTGNGGGE
jgi:hypothetical protein